MSPKDYLLKQDTYLHETVISKRGKKRTLVTYKKTKKGNEFRTYHESLLIQLNRIPSNRNSFAYKNGFCTKDALENHMQSNLFIKLDIHSFFESITKENFLDVAKERIKDIDEDDIKMCFYKDHLSLGLVTSPKISDIYLNEFDNMVENYIANFPELKYSRYCDDILISSTENNAVQLHTLEGFIVKSLDKFSLSVNEKKRREFDLSKDTAVSFLGLNIVKHENERIITISKGFILKTLKEIDKVLEAEDKSRNEDEDDLLLDWFIHKKKLSVNSRVAYIKNNSEYSYNRFLKKYKNKYGKEWNKEWQ